MIDWSQDDLGCTYRLFGWEEDHLPWSEVFASNEVMLRIYLMPIGNPTKFTHLALQFNYAQPTQTTMGYPDTFEGFQVNSTEKWSDFKKQEVG